MCAKTLVSYSSRNEHVVSAELFEVSTQLSRNRLSLPVSYFLDNLRSLTSELTIFLSTTCEAIGELRGREGADVYCLDQCLNYGSKCPEDRCRCF